MPSPRQCHGQLTPGRAAFGGFLHFQPKLGRLGHRRPSEFEPDTGGVLLCIFPIVVRYADAGVIPRPEQAADRLDVHIDIRTQADDLFALAAQGTRAAKRAGRNRVVAV